MLRTIFREKNIFAWLIGYKISVKRVRGAYYIMKDLRGLKIAVTNICLLLGMNYSKIKEFNPKILPHKINHLFDIASVHANAYNYLCLCNISL